MAAEVQKPKMTMVRFNHRGQEVVLGILRRFSFNGGEALPLVEGHSLVELLNREHDTNLKIISPQVADAVLTTEGRHREEIAGCLRFSTSACIIYEKPGTTFGRSVVFAYGEDPRMVFEMPQIYRGQKDSALVALDLTAANFRRNGKEIVLEVPGDNLVLVERFPSRNGAYNVEPRTIVPHLEEKKDTPERYLNRLVETAYVGPIVRGIDLGGSIRSGLIAASFRLTGRWGVVVEVPSADVEKFEAVTPAKV